MEDVICGLCFGICGLWVGVEVLGFVVWAWELGGMGFEVWGLELWVLGLRVGRAGLRDQRLRLRG